MTEKEFALYEFIQAQKELDVILIPVLHKAKELYGNISIDVQNFIAEQLQIPISQVAGTVTFYSEFNGMSDGDVDEYFLQNVEHQDAANKYMLNTKDTYEALKKVINENLDVISMLKESRVCGRSGSGFSVGIKWEMTKNAEAEEKYIICNASEGEGDTYKDLILMSKVPHAMMEGMIICGIATGIQKGYLYVRAEYHEAYKNMKAAIETAYKHGFLGSNILGSGKNFDIELICGGGAYVCGEETALIQSLEGKRGEPRLKPPYPGTAGFNANPTIINNAESFAAVPMLIIMGIEEFKNLGTENSGGSKLFTVSGCVNNPGVYELPHHITVRQIIDGVAGGIKDDITLKGFQIGGGATGSFVGIDDLDTVLDYKTCMMKGFALGTGSIHFFGENESVITNCGKCIDFLANQSCGMCAPCKYALREMSDLINKIADRKGTNSDLEELQCLSEYIKNSSRCGLGQAAPTAFSSAFRAFKNEFQNACQEGGR